jgi:exonuclease SbcD
MNIRLLMEEGAGTAWTSKIKNRLLDNRQSCLPSAMRILHTADWHLGARLVERDRLPEHAAFLDWLIDTLRSEKIDALLVSGDVFDAANPPQDAIALYFDLLKRLADLKTVQAVITGGNHDSASHLNAPRELLKRFDMHVFGHAGENNVVDLGGAVVAAVPFLRERDLRQTTAGETIATVHEQLRAAIRAHYAAQLAACRQLAQGRPVIAMGHLTVLGATTSDSERDIHIGNLGAVGTDIFTGFDYTALGHLHRPQRVASLETIRYSGSPIALSFSEAADKKSVVILNLQNHSPAPILLPAKASSRQENGGSRISINTVPIPTTRQLIRATVNRATLAADLQTVPAGSWAEITVKLDAPEPDLDRQVREAAAGRFEVLKVLADLPATSTTPWQHTGPALHDLQPRDVFRELIKERQIEGEELSAVFDELLALREEKTISQS